MTTRILLVPGGTSIGAVALAHAGIHKIVELHRERDAAQPHTVLTIRDPADVPASTLRTAALSPREAFPADRFPQLDAHIDDPALFDGVDLVLPTSGSTGTPRWVGLSIEALLHSAHATHQALAGPGRWVLALPTHHVAGAMVLLRAVAAGCAPLIVDTTGGFSPSALLPAIRGATGDPAVPGYISLVPTQLRACMTSDEAVAALGRMAAVLVGGAACPDALADEATARGIRVVRTYGMTETCGGCVYDGYPLPGTTLGEVTSLSALTIADRTKQTRTAHPHMPAPAGKDTTTISQTRAGRLSISGPMVLTRYLDEGGAADRRTQAFVTHDTGVFGADGRLTVTGRTDDVIVSGGLNISPRPVHDTLSAVPHVAQCAVLGSADDQWGQVVTAVVVLHQPFDGVDAAVWGPRLRDAVAQQLGAKVAPRRFLFVEHLPVLTLGKVDRLWVRRLVDDTSVAAQVKEWRR
nr:AMP-binding protein [Schaalia suimastitidis]